MFLTGRDEFSLPKMKMVGAPLLKRRGLPDQIAEAKWAGVGVRCMQWLPHPGYPG